MLFTIELINKQKWLLRWCFGEKKLFLKHYEDRGSIYFLVCALNFFDLFFIVKTESETNGNVNAIETHAASRVTMMFRRNFAFFEEKSGA